MMQCSCLFVPSMSWLIFDGFTLFFFDCERDWNSVYHYRVGILKIYNTTPDMRWIRRQQQTGIMLGFQRKIGEK